MKILLTGASGQLGTELRLVLPALGSVTSADIAVPEGEPGDFHELDFCDSQGIKALLDEIHPDVIVNAAAYTQVDKAESEPELATRINAKAPGLLGAWARQNEAFLVHYSTDYVFDGTSKQAYQESDPTFPVNAYGESKLAGEQAVADSGCQHVTLRTSWIYSSHGTNFLNTMLKLASERSHLSVVNDQFGCPTWARNLARVSATVIENHARCVEPTSSQAPLHGLYHYCDSPPCTWYDFANQIFETAVSAGLLGDAPQVEPVTSDQFQAASRRPEFSVLDTSRIENDLGIAPATVKESIRACLQELN